MRKPSIKPNIFKERRSRLGALIPGSALILPAHPDLIRNHDVHFPFRQDTNLFYLTGFEEPESVLVFRPGCNPETVLFTRVRDVERETWDGFRYGPEGVVREFGIDASYPIEQFDSIAAELLLAVDRVYYTLFKNLEFDQRMAKTLLSTKEKRRRSGRGILPIYDSYPLIGEMRVRKSEYEIETMKRACQVSAEAHNSLIQYIKPGVSEREIHGAFIYEIMKRGAAREGYGGIVATGNGATTLHYTFNDQPLKSGELLLVDAGAEVDYYTGDITRMYPVGGKFSAVQARLYSQVLDLQKELCSMVKPGLVFSKLQEHAIYGLTEIMIREKLLKMDHQSAIQSLAYKKYYPHGVSHFLGMDVHDAGLIEVHGESRILEQGMMLTIEPGIYIPQNDLDAPEELRGLGIRIEDDIVVTYDGSDNMTSAARKEIKDLES